MLPIVQNPMQQAQQLATGGLFPPYYTTGQADQAAAANIASVQGKTLDQTQYETAEGLNRARAAQNLGQQQMQYVGNMGNAAANANTSRGMATNAQQALNNIYQQAGDRLNSAAANTMASINNAGQIAAGMFR